MRAGQRMGWATAVVMSAACCASVAEEIPFWAQKGTLVLAEPESVYAPPAPAREDQGVNQGAVHIDLKVTAFTDYVWRGIERFELSEQQRDALTDAERSQLPAEDRANTQFDGKVSLDLGDLPHPYVAVFLNVADGGGAVNVFLDNPPVDGETRRVRDDSSFQEIRPTVGFDWTVRPFTLSAGHTSYIFPERNRDFRDRAETSEVFARLELDDGYFFKTDKPILSPYVFAAYDYDNFNGWYIEAGVRHDFEIEDTPLTLTAEAHVSYVRGLGELFSREFAIAVLPDGSSFTIPEDDEGFQHYQVGLIADYSLNTLFNFSRRYGELSLRGYVYYTDGIDDGLRADTQIWGGLGIGFNY